MMAGRKASRDAGGGAPTPASGRRYQLEERDPRTLADNPRKGLLPELAPPLAQLLAENAGRSGLIYVTDGGVIVDGHRRVRDAIDKGLTSIQVAVISDLADDDAGDEYLAANLHARQLNKYERAHIFRVLMAEHGRNGPGEGERRARYAKQLDLGTGVNAERIARLLELPRLLLDAVVDGEITQSLGKAYLDLPENTQDQVMRDVETREQGEDISVALKEAINRHRHAQGKTESAQAIPAREQGVRPYEESKESIAPMSDDPGSSGGDTNDEEPVPSERVNASQSPKSEQGREPARPSTSLLSRRGSFSLVVSKLESVAEYLVSHPQLGPDSMEQASRATNALEQISRALTSMRKRHPMVPSR